MRSGVAGGDLQRGGDQRIGAIDGDRRDIGGQTIGWCYRGERAVGIHCGIRQGGDRRAAAGDIHRTADRHIGGGGEAADDARSDGAGDLGRRLTRRDVQRRRAQHVGAIDIDGGDHQRRGACRGCGQGGVVGLGDGGGQRVDDGVGGGGSAGDIHRAGGWRIGAGGKGAAAGHNGVGDGGGGLRGGLTGRDGHRAGGEQRIDAIDHDIVDSGRVERGR